MSPNTHGTIIWPVDEGQVPDAPTSIPDRSIKSPLSWSPVSQARTQRSKLDENHFDDAWESALQESGMVKFIFSNARNR